MTAVTDNREIARRMVEDPRYVAAKAAFDAFKASPAGQRVDAALGSPSYRAETARLDPDDLARYHTHADNWTRTRAQIIAELRGEAG